MDDQDQSSQNIDESGSMSIHIQLPNILVGSIIGKQGENIKAIREQTQSRVQIADVVPGSEDRDVTLKGSMVSVGQAVDLILTTIAQVKAQQNVSVEGAETEISLKLLVANDQCGAIIGKGGEVVKQLREQSGSRITIGKKVDLVRTIDVSGSLNCVRAAFSVLVRLVHDHPSAGRDPFLHGFRSQPQTAIPSAYGMAQVPAYNYGMSGGLLGQSYGQTSHGLSAYGAAAGASDASSLSLSIPHRAMGAIIGKRGQTINEIRNISGCRIEITNQEEGSQFRTINISGPSHCIEIAHMLIQKYSLQTPAQ